eukprot:TRINITY_DN43639_c0_g1_i1.p2 TRINITY_DN43639_c0_g1~~TRINITY_DN43639_c0_g1_i1.p2  ORF type:complete len:164 (+),score=49.87 TRINITY_DN43639_c0_g1_i1:71-562(+)
MNMRRCVLLAAALAVVILCGALLFGDFARVGIMNERLVGRDIRGKTIHGCSIRKSVLRDCTVSDSLIFGGTVVGGKLSSVDVKGGAVLINVTLRHATLHDAELSWCDARNVDIEGRVVVSGGKMAWGEVKKTGQLEARNWAEIDDLDGYSEPPTDRKQAADGE